MWSSTNLSSGVCRRGIALSASNGGRWLSPQRLVPSPRRSEAQAQAGRVQPAATATLCLLAAGAVMVYSASSARTLLEGQGDGTMYLVKYLAYAAVGLVVLQLLARGGLELLPRLTPALLALSFALVVAVKIPGIGVSSTAPALDRSGTAAVPALRAR